MPSAISSYVGAAANICEHGRSRLNHTPGNAGFRMSGMPARACGRARDASFSGGHGSVVCMQDGACAMGRARCKGRNGTGGVASSTGFSPAGWRSEVAREIFLGHILGWRTKEIRVENQFNCWCIRPNFVTQTHLATRGDGKAHKRNLCHTIPF